MSGSSLAEYLRAPARSALVGLLLLPCAADWSQPERSLAVPVTLGLGGVAIAHLLGKPRWLSYLFLGLCLCLATAQRVYFDAPRLDADSDRDECAEMAVGELLAGRDPWGKRLLSGNPVTTGPADVLLLVPFVAAFGRLDEAAFAFWGLVAGLWLWADLRHRNQTFELLALCAVAGLFGISHTQEWSLDELYFALPLFVLAWRLAERRRWGGVGAAIATAMLWRLSYAFPAAAFLLWLASRVGWRDTARVVPGATAAAVVLCLPFLCFPTGLFAGYGPFGTALDYAAAPDFSVLHRVLTVVPLSAPVALVLKLSLAVGALWLVCCGLAGWRLPHPFWHVAAGGFVAHTLMWRPSDAPDYALMFVLPAFFAVACGAPLYQPPDAPPPPKRPPPPE